MRHNLGYNSEDKFGNIMKDYVALRPKLLEFKHLEPYEEYPWDVNVREVIPSQNAETNCEGHWCMSAVVDTMKLKGRESKCHTWHSSLASA